MSFPVPPDLDRRCAQLRERVERAQREVQELRADSVRRDQLERDRWATAAPQRRAAAETLIRWLAFLDASGARRRLAASGAPSVDLLCPLTQDGRDTWLHSGARRYELALTGPPVLIEHHRQGPAWGRTSRLATADEIADTVPTAICLRLAEAATVGTIWNGAIEFQRDPFRY